MQIQLIAGLTSHFLSSVTVLYSSAVELGDLYWPAASHMSGSPTKATAAAAAGTNEPLPAVQSLGQLNGSSSFADSPNAGAVPPGTMTSESVSLERLVTDSSWNSSGVDLSVWIQWTLLKLVVNMYGRSQENKGCVLFIWNSLPTGLSQRLIPIS